jgi:MFS family permease
MTDPIPHLDGSGLGPPARAGSRSERLLTLPFCLIVASGLAYFVALAMLNPVFGPYVKDRLGRSDAGVGAAAGAFAVGAIVLRPYAGRVGDRLGRRPLLIGGAVIVCGATALYGAVEDFAFFVAMRVIAGLGEAAFFVGAATMITDRAPVERRGEAVSYWSIAVYGGLAFGPVLGEYVLGPDGDRFRACFAVAAIAAGIAIVLALATRESHDRPPPPEEPGHLLHRAAIGPGFVLFLGFVSLAGWNGFVKLYARDDLDGASVGGVFFLYGALILVVRIAGARLPDRLGARRAGTGALGLGALGIAIVAAFPSIGGLYAGTAVFALGQSLAYPALLVLALQGVDDSERASVVGTFSSSFDLSQGLGGLLCGFVAEQYGYRQMFATGAALAIVGLVYLRRAPNLRRVVAPGPAR